MEHKQGQQGEVHLTHFDYRMIALDPEVGTGSIKDDGVKHSEDDISNAITIQVGRAPIVASRVEVDHIWNGRKKSWIIYVFLRRRWKSDEDRM